LLQQDRGAFYSYLRDLGMDNDPAHVFTLTNGVLHITGQHYGYLATKQRFDRPGRNPWEERLGFRGPHEIEKPRGD
jgi:hypothetical protein